jgi:hypothetical protein
MFNVRTPLSRELATWVVARGLPLWDWSALPVVADAVQEALGDEYRDEVLGHGRWLVLTQTAALCRPLWTMPKAEWYHKPSGLWSAGELGKAIRWFCAPRGPIRAPAFDEKAREIVARLQARTEKAKDLFRGADGRTHGEFVLVRDLLERFLACEPYRPRAGGAG